MPFEPLVHQLAAWLAIRMMKNHQFYGSVSGNGQYYDNGSPSVTSQKGREVHGGAAIAT